MKKYNNLLSIGEYIRESRINEERHCISDQAKSVLEKACEECLLKEAEDYENDENESHTYEGYTNGCISYLKEMMGNRGYSSLVKHYR
jgi:hypothetical protein